MSFLLFLNKGLERFYLLFVGWRSALNHFIKFFRRNLVYSPIFFIERYLRYSLRQVVIKHFSRLFLGKFRNFEGLFVLWRKWSMRNILFRCRTHICKTVLNIIDWLSINIWDFRRPIWTYPTYVWNNTILFWL